MRIIRAPETSRAHKPGGCGSLSILRRLFVTCCVFTRYFFVAFSGFFRGFFVALFCLEKQCSGLFRYFFLVFSWLFRGFFRGPCFGQILRVLALEQSSEIQEVRKMSSSTFSFSVTSSDASVTFVPDSFCGGAFQCCERCFKPFFVVSMVFYVTSYANIICTRAGQAIGFRETRAI